MKTKLHFALCVFAMLFSVNTIRAQVQIGSGTSVNQALPIEPFYGYTYSQSIYTSAEINASGSITGVKFYANGATTLTNSSDWTVYIGHTTKNSFANTSDWVDVSTLTQVFSGTATISGGEVVITFSTPFNYNGSDNLIIAVDENQASYDGSGEDFYCSATPVDRSLTYRDDTNNPDPNAPPTATYMRSYIPNIELMGITSTCALPTNVTASNITTNSADISWTDNTGGTAVGYEIEVGTNGFTPTGTATNTGNSPVSVSGLSPSTAYDYYIRTDCGAGDFSSWSGPYSFSTSCSPLTATYTQNFDGALASDPFSGITCWSIVGAGSNDLELSSSTDDGEPIPSLPNVVEFNDGDLSDPDSSILVSPEFSDLGSGLNRIRLLVHQESPTVSSSHLYIGTMSDPTDVTTFVMYDSITHAEMMANPGFNEHTVNFDNTALIGSNQYIALMHGSDIYEIYIDDFVYEPIPSCLAPTSFTITGSSGSTVDLSWVENNGSSSWNIEYGPAGFTPGNGTTIPVGTNPFTVTGLNEATSYDFYIQTDCGGSDQSIWTGPVNTTTGLNAFSCSSGFNTIYETSDFENDIPSFLSQTATSAPIWTFDGAGGTSSTNTGPSGAYSGSGYIYLECTGGSAGETDTLYGDPVDLSTSSGQARLVFYYHMYGADMGTLQVDISDDGGSNWTTEWSQTGQVQNDETDPWLPVAIDLSSYSGSTILYRIVGIKGADYESDMAIDSLVIEGCVPCAAPYNVMTSNITGNSVDLSWSQNGSPASWNIEYGPAGFTPGTGTTVSAGTNPYTLTGLSETTSYDIYIQSDCGADLSTWEGPISIATGLAPFSCTSGNPYVLLFEEFEGSFPSNWSKVNTSAPDWEWDSNTTSSTTTGPSMGNTNPGYLYLETSGGSQGDADTLMSPQVDLTNVIGEAKLTFFYHMYGSTMGELKVRISDDNGASWTQLWSISGEQQSDETDPWLPVAVDLTSYAGGVVDFQIIGVRGSNYYSDMAIDDFKVEVCISCPPPSNINISNITETSADIDWTAGGSETSWNIEYGPAGFTPGTGTLINTSNNPETLSGLIDNTDYDVYVQADCGGGDLSTWTGPANFTTATYCTAPVAFQTTGSTASSIDLQWAATGTETSWNIEYGPAGFTPGTGSGTIEVATTIPYTVTGLQPGTVYEFYVQAGCSQGQNNPFTGPITYSTPIVNDAACDAIAVPVDGSTTQYTNAGATLETGELTALGDNTVWFTFTAPADGHVEIRTCGNDFDNFMEVYETTDCADFGAYTIVDAATDNPFASCSGTTDPAGLVLCGLTPGNTYYLAVGSETAGNTGIFPLTLTAIPNAEAGNGTVTQVCSGDVVNLFGALSGNDNGGVWSEIDVTGGLDVNGTYVTTNLAYTDFDVQYTVNNECSMDSAIVTVSISGPSQAGQDGTLADCNVLTDFYLYDGLSGNLDFGGTWVDVDGTGKLNGSVFSPDSLAAGTYQFDYITSNDVCPADTSTVEVTIQDCLGTEEFTAESFKIFPNPTQGIFYIVSTVNAQDAVVEITDLQGKVISSRQMNINAGAQYDFDLSQLERGVYLIKMATEDNTSIKRVVLQR